MSSRPPTKDRTISPASFAFSMQGQIAHAADACTSGFWQKKGGRKERRKKDKRKKERMNGRNKERKKEIKRKKK